MLTLYYSPGACSLASHIILEEIGTPFAAKRVLTAAGEHRRPEYLALNPQGRVPTLATESFVLTENTAILSYLGHRYPEVGVLALDNLQQLARAHELLAFFASNVHIAFAQVWRAERFADDAAAQGEWLIGNRFSIADPYLLVFYRWGRDRLGFDMSRYPTWTAHKDRMLARPPIQRALAYVQAARRHLLLRASYDVDENGLFDAPPIRVVVGDESHATLLKMLGILGLGRARIERVETDDQGRIRPDRPPPLDARTIRLHPGRQCEFGRVRPVPPDRRGRACGGRVAPRRRRLRAVGQGVAASRAFGRWRRAGGQLGGRRAQVAERAL